MKKCKYADELQNNRRLKDGTHYCKHKKVYCDGYSYDLNGDAFVIIEDHDVCVESSLFGNANIVLTDNIINQLKLGKILQLDGASKIFVRYEEINNE